ncbi:MAG TPA: S8 family serine peptidase, partial [bacterium]|nr:S8 family serine peptidase [bacterium]
MRHILIAILFFHTVVIFSARAQNASHPSSLIVKFRPKSQLSKTIEDRKAWIQRIQTGTKEPIHIGSAFNNKHTFFDDTYIIQLAPNLTSDEINSWIANLSAQSDIEYVTPNHLFRLDDVGINDPLADSLYWIQRTAAKKAWALTQGRSGIIIGIIDSGIEYDHPDLTAQIFRNAGEMGTDAWGNDKKSNGIDDDNNGYADDWQGWDFVDAPALAGDGDATDEDNDPSDENGHGTSVAGIAAATGNNHIGVIGMAFGCRVMNLRAGGKSGFLEEDDVARAIVYAADNGAQIINCSFGDREYGPLLRDAIRYASDRNIVIVASAGNSSSSALHYPSSFDDVIGVSATAKDDFFAGFSNYGTRIDVAAPGVDILTTATNHGYRFFSGTSASAPLVSGLAALMLSLDSTLSRDDVRATLQQSAEDIGEIGWEPYYGHGRIHAQRALLSIGGTGVVIHYPAQNQGIIGNNIPVRITAAGRFMASVRLLIGSGTNPSSWTEVASSENHAFVNDVLTDLDISDYSPGTYSLRLEVTNKDGSLNETVNRFFIDHTAPVISDFVVRPMLYGKYTGYHIQFQTDDLCESYVRLRIAGSSESGFPLPIKTLSQNHSIFISTSDFRGQYEAAIEVINAAGDTAYYDNNGSYYPLNLTQTELPVSAFQIDTSFKMPAAYLYPRSTDMDNDGKPELTVNTYNNAGEFAWLRTYEFSGTSGHPVSLVHDYISNGVPRDIDDSASGGKMRLLAGMGSSTVVYESVNATGLPISRTYKDSNDFWGSRFADMDGDGLPELIGKKGSAYQIRKNTASSWTTWQTLPNPTGGGNLVGVPGSAVGDFDHDGHQEILLGDYDGNIFIYELTGNSATLIWTDSLHGVDANAFMESGDFDGDGFPEFAVGVHSEDPSSESDAVNSYWLWRIYKTTRNNDYTIAWEQYFYGYAPLAQFPSGASSQDINNDQRPDLLLSLYPYAYILTYDASSQQYVWYWHSDHVLSNTIAAADANHDGFSELYIGDGTATRRFVLQGLTAYELPSALAIFPSDTDRIQIQWQTRPGIDSLLIFRGTHADTLALIVTIAANAETWTDSAVQKNKPYYYRIQARYGNASSDVSGLFFVRPNPKPSVVSVEMYNANFIRARFSEPIHNESLSQNFHYLLDDRYYPASAIPVEGGQAVMLHFTQLASGTHRLFFYSQHDTDGTPSDT